MKIDAWTHILSGAYTDHLEGLAATAAGAFLLAQRALRDVDFRLRTLDGYGDYRQILTPIPCLLLDPALTGRELCELVRRNNDEMADLVRRHADRFAGFAAATPISDDAAATDEAVRCVRELDALGVQLEADPVSLPLHDARYEPLFAAIHDLDAAIWLHPCRTPATPGPPQPSTPLLLWQIFGWPFDTTITAARLILAGIYDRHPQLTLIAHHGGGVIPHLAGRIELLPMFAAMDPALTTALATLDKAPIDYFRLLYADTAMFGAPHATRCVLDFFKPERVLFASDAPFDTQDGAHLIPATTADIQRAIEDSRRQAAIFSGNAQRALRL